MMMNHWTDANSQMGISAERFTIPEKLPLNHCVLGASFDQSCEVIFAIRSETLHLVSKPPGLGDANRLFYENAKHHLSTFPYMYSTTNCYYSTGTFLP